MMRSEFIERTGFEPMGDEYAEIEREYMAADIDKDEFCRDWKKNGGINRLMRVRASRIREMDDIKRADERHIRELTDALNEAEDNNRELKTALESCKADAEWLREQNRAKDKEIQRLNEELEALYQGDMATAQAKLEQIRAILEAR